MNTRIPPQPICSRVQIEIFLSVLQFQGSFTDSLSCEIKLNSGWAFCYIKLSIFQKPEINFILQNTNILEILTEDRRTSEVAAHR